MPSAKLTITAVNKPKGGVDIELKDFQAILEILKKYELNSLNDVGLLLKALRKIGVRNIKMDKPEPKLGNNGEPAIDEGEAQDKAEYLIGER